MALRRCEQCLGCGTAGELISCESEHSAGSNFLVCSGAVFVYSSIMRQDYTKTSACLVLHRNFILQGRYM